jgi:hypothetical protein
MNFNARELAYQIDPVLWVKEVLGITPDPWQERFLREPHGASILVLTARQVGKTTTAAWAIAHCMLFRPDSLSVIACPAQRQSAEAVRRVRDILLQAGAKLEKANVFALELDNGSRVLALPGSPSSIRGLTVGGWIVVDEAAQVDEELIAALRPMRARRPEARLAMVSTAWTRIDPFWMAWTNEEADWTRLQVTGLAAGYEQVFLDQELKSLGREKFDQEYMGIPAGGAGSLFSWDLYDSITSLAGAVVAPGSAFRPPQDAPGIAIPNPFAALKRTGVIP